jgi:hypothetical protein
MVSGVVWADGPRVFGLGVKRFCTLCTRVVWPGPMLGSPASAYPPTPAANVADSPQTQYRFMDFPPRNTPVQDSHSPCVNRRCARHNCLVPLCGSLPERQPYSWCSGGVMPRADRCVKASFSFAQLRSVQFSVFGQENGASVFTEHSCQTRLTLQTPTVYDELSDTQSMRDS